MKLIKDLEFGFADAENYKRRENKQLLNKLFIRDNHLDKLCDPSVSFLIGEKGTGKTAYSIYLSNNEYKETLSEMYYIRETEYQKFVSLKREKHLSISDFSSIWKVTLYLLMSKHVNEKEGSISKLLNYKKFNSLNSAIDEYYYDAFSPEIVQALSFAEESKYAAELLNKHAKLRGEEKDTKTFSESRFQVNLFYIQKQFESALSQIRLSKNHIIFIDGIDIRPSNMPYNEYIECIKGLANAVWEINNDFFPTIKGGKGRMKVVLLIRPDIFDSLGLQNQNTKIRDNSVLLDWRADYNVYRASQLFAVVDHMLATQQDGSFEVGKVWDAYFPWNSSNYDSDSTLPTSFISFLRWSYYRPRDILTMLQLLRLDESCTTDKEFFTYDDFNNPRFQRDYSNYLLGEVKDHLSFYYSSEEYEIFLKFFEFLSGKNKFNYKQYVTAFKKFQDYMQTIPNEQPKFTVTANVFLQFLFDLNVICYIEKTEDHKTFIHWCFKDRSYANISPKIKTEMEYQVFYGLAKALNLGKELE